jgi:hypothetical protein
MDRLDDAIHVCGRVHLFFLHLGADNLVERFGILQPLRM